MPFTPLHFGPALFISMLFFHHLDFTALMISNVIVDIEPIIILVFGLKIPLHGFFHSYLGAAILAITTALLINLTKNHLNKILSLLRIQQGSSFRTILITSFLGAYSHVLLDSFLYGEMNPFYPITGNPFQSLSNSLLAYYFCIVTFILGLILYIRRLIVLN